MLDLSNNWENHILSSKSNYGICTMRTITGTGKPWSVTVDARNTDTVLVTSDLLRQSNVQNQAAFISPVTIKVRRFAQKRDSHFTSSLQHRGTQNVPNYVLLG
ncbi:hypothetical protein GE061_015539 [Apolygus lucorum]|uniref:Uncharacterized protein n=1 Tax=Apolygus lucorum TaxID=248454 RepID=A0A8S9XME8_APOLU|nr:hypothetical protein GE061_015539 [Apolygus lucorum]